MADAVRYLRARHVATMTPDGIIRDGCVAFADGRVVQAGPMNRVNPPRVDETIDGLLSPGLVNAHTHLELTNVARPASPGTFQEWLLATMSSMREPDLATFNRKRVEAVRAGIAQCLKFGVTCVGDISQNVDVVRPVLGQGPIRSISYGECLGLGERRARFSGLLARATAGGTASDRMAIGISPHAPYTVDADGYRDSYNEQFSDLDIAWTTHIAETADEAAFIRNRTGPFAGLYAKLGFDPGPGEGFAGTPIGWLHRVIEPHHFDLLVHVNYCTDDDLQLLAAWSPNVVWCPRTHAYFGHPPHRWREMKERGIAVSVGTDSCASSPDLNLMDDLRVVRQQNPDVPASELWKMVTVTPAEAQRGPREGEPLQGRLAAGAAADFVAWPTLTDDPLTEVLDTAGLLPTRVWIGGEAACPAV